MIARLSRAAIPRWKEREEQEKRNYKVTGFIATMEVAGMVGRLGSGVM